MNLKNSIFDSGKCAISLIGLVSAFYSVINLMIFLSDPYQYRPANYPRQDERITNCLWMLLVDMVLLALFIGQHSILASDKLKIYFEKYGILDIYRSFYIITSAICLQILFTFWFPILEVTLWQLNLNYKPVWYTYYGIHILAWIFIYVGNVCMDINELLGIKQVIYSIKNLPGSNKTKSQELRKLCSHINHPSFTAFILLFWTTPVMSLDRLVLAVIFTIYLMIGCKTDQSDYTYHKAQYFLKCQELRYLKS
ncbi:nurim homolog [Coccinella septempunctata]|uniref:nurim homolog n=1 Tax=Coccinella septempunctata TaxID=41139 RepID=UPI001D08D8BE|nr:nurim homolog [Coccinella septempunctata]